MKRQNLSRLCRLRSRHCGQVFIFIIIASMFLCSCAMVDSATQKIGLADTGGKPETFYVGLSDLKLFPEPQFSKTCIARLPLHEEVVRDKLEKGFAHVRVVKTGQTGWVQNAHLVWRRSPLQQSPSKESISPEKKPAEENVIQEPTHPNPEIDGRDAAIFNRF
jgi:hypothetical protein